MGLAFAGRLGGWRQGLRKPDRQGKEDQADGHRPRVFQRQEGQRVERTEEQDHHQGKNDDGRAEAVLGLRVLRGVAGHSFLLGPWGLKTGAPPDQYADEPCSPLTIAIPELAPIRVAPAAIIACASASDRTPPEALTPRSGPTVRRIRATSPAVAPPPLKPVEVLTKSAPASTAAWQASTFWPSLSSAVSIMTFRMAPPSWTASATAVMSSTSAP